MFQQTPLKRVLFPYGLKPAVLGVFVALSLLFSIFGILLRPAQAAAATNGTINFQARLENAAGNIAPDGNYNVQFKLYGTSTGGSALWTETYQNSNSQGITVKNGYLTANLGSITAFPTTINWDQDLYVTLNIGGTSTSASPTYDGEMNPRLHLTSVPYAFRAGQLAQFNNGNGFTSVLQVLQPTSGNQTFQIPDMGVAGTYNVCIANSSACGFALSSGSTSYIQSQTTLSSAQTNSNFWISGTGRAATSLQAPLIDAATASTALNIGTTNASVINLNQNVVVANNKTLTANGNSLFQAVTASQTAFQISNTSSTPLINVDSTTLNLVSNSSFEPNITNWSAKGTATLSQTSSQSFQGFSSLQAIVSAASSGVTTSAFTSALVANTQYEVTFMAACSASVSTFTYGHQDVSGTDINAATTTNCDSNWRRYTYHFTTGATVTSPNIYMTLGSAASGTFWVDAVQVLQTNTTGAQPYSAGSVKIDGVIADPVVIRNVFNSTNAFEVQDTTGHSNTLVADTANNQVTVGGSLNVGGAITGSSTITGTTLNGTTGLNTGSGAGTQRLDASGNLVNIANLSANGTAQFSGTTGSSYIMSAFGLGTTNPQTGSALTVANGSWISGVDASGSGYVNMFQVNSNNQIQVGAALNVDGGIVLPADGGRLTVIDEPFSTGITAGTPNSYTFGIGQSNALTVYGENDGSGNAQNVRVAIGSSIAPAYTLDVGGDANITGDYRIGGTSVISASRVLQNVTADAGILTSGTLGIARGGTGVSTTPTNGQLLIGNGTGYTLGTIGSGSGISVTNGTGTISVAVDGTVCRTTNNCSAVGSAGGDLSGSFPNPTIAKLQGSTLTLNTPAGGNFLEFNGTAWVNQSVSGDITISSTGVAAIGNSKVTSAMIADGTVTGTDIANNTITNSDIQSGAFSNITGTGALTSGSIGSGFGTISTGNNITTTATVQGGTVNATGTLQTAGTDRIDSSGNLVNINNITAIGTMSITAVNSRGYQTSNTSNTNIGQWTKLGSCTILIQYSACRTQATVVSIADGGSLSRGQIDIRIKQQAAMGSAPYVNLDLTNASGLTASNFVAVTTVNTVSQTTVELWGQINASYQQWAISPLITADSVSFTWLANQGFQTSLPAGTQTMAFYSDAYVGIVSATGSISTSGSISVNGQSVITSGRVLQNVTADAGILTSGTIASGRLSGSYTGITGVGSLTAGSIASGFGIISTNNNITTSATVTGVTVNGTSAIQTNGTNRIDSAGNLVNINTITAGTVNVNDQINLQASAVSSQIAFNFSGKANANFNFYNGGGASGASVALINGSTGDFSNNGVIVSSGTGNSSFAGNLGIGTTTPGSYRLNVQGGDVNFSGNFSIGGTTVITSSQVLQNVTANASILTSGTITSARISGSYTGITAVGTLTSLTVSGVITSTVATGTAPLSVTSTTVVTNLNADMVDGQHASAFAATSGDTSYIWNGTSQQGSANFNISGNGTVGGTMTAGQVTATANNSSSTSSLLSVNQSGTGNSTIQISTPSTTWNMGANQSNGSNFTLSSSTGNNSKHYFGNEQGIYLDSGEVGDAFCSVFAARETGTVSSLYLYFDQNVDSTNHSAQVAMYSANGTSGGPGTKLVSASGTIGGSGYQSFAVPSTGVTAGTSYWLCFEHGGTSSTNNVVFNRAQNSSAGFFWSSALGTWAASPSGTFVNVQFAVFAAYTPSTTSSYTTPILQASSSGDVTIQAVTNSATALQVADMTGTDLLTVDANGAAVRVGTANAGSLYVGSADIRTSYGKQLDIYSDAGVRLYGTNSSNSTTAFQVQNAGGYSVLNVDTTNSIIKVGSAGSTATPAYLYVYDYSTNAAGSASIVGNWNSANTWGIGANSNSSTDNTVRIGATSAIGNNAWSTSQNLNLLVAGTETVRPNPGSDSTSAFQVQNAGGTTVLAADTVNEWAIAQGGPNRTALVVTDGTTSWSIQPGLYWNGSTMVAASGWVNMDLGGTGNINISDNFVITGGHECILTVTCNNALGVNGWGVASGGWTTGTPDIAEYITTATDVSAYDVVAADPANAEAVVKATSDRSGAMVGVISDGTSGFQMKNAHYGQAFDPNSDNTDPNAKPMTLAGRIPVHVTNENGVINPGDYLTVSATKPGYAMKATHAGPTIGKALGFFDGTSGNTVLALINLSYYDPNDGNHIQSQSGSFDTLQAGSASFSSLNVSGPTTLASLTVTGSASIGGDLTVTGRTSVGDIMVNGHIVTSGLAPSIVVGDAAGKPKVINGVTDTTTAAAVTVDGNDSAGTISLTTGDNSITGGALVHLSFAQNFTTGFKVVISASNGAASKASVYVTKTSDGFDVVSDDALSPSTTYQFDYIVLGSQTAVTP